MNLRVYGGLRRLFLVLTFPFTFFNVLFVGECDVANGWSCKIEPKIETEARRRCPYHMYTCCETTSLERLSHQTKDNDGSTAFLSDS